MAALLRIAALAALAPLAPACACDPCTEAPTPIDDDANLTSYRSDKYADEAQWLCRGDGDDDACDGDLTATEVLPGGELAVVEHVPLDAPPVDCFYVYPTVDLGLGPGVNDPRAGALQSVARTQAARFSETCAVWAPMYRQVTLGTYGEDVDDDTRERCFAIALSDVRDAFLHFVAQLSNDRPFVLLGHSQGTHHLQSIVRDLVDQSEALRARLVVALLVGGSVSVDADSDRGGSFANVPLCAAADDTGCVVAYRSYADGTTDIALTGAARLADFASDDGDELACNGPDARGDDVRPLSRSYLGAGGLLGDVPDVDTPFVLYRERFTAGCAQTDDGARFLAVAAVEDDARPSPVDLDGDRWRGATGLHVLDVQLALGDLIDTTAARIAARIGSE